MTGTAPPRIVPGWLSAEVAAELPGLRLRQVTAAHRWRRSPPPLAQRLRALSDRWRGASVVALRTRPVAHAYRAFFRQVGLDPDVRRVPGEAAAVARLRDGGFMPTRVLDDARLVALLETGVPVWALDGAVVDASGLGIRTSTVGDATDPERSPAVPGTLVVADRRAVHAELFAEPLPGHAAGPRSERIALYALGVDGVPEIHLEEALWCVVELL